MYNKKENFLRDLSKEAGSFLFFQLFKIILNTLPIYSESKRNMLKIVRSYYRGNLTELANIDEFDKTYQRVDAIPWFMKDCFLSK